MNSSQRQSNKGYIYVASVNKLYYELGLESASSLRDLYPEANITLFTHDMWVDSRAEKLFNNIVTGIPIHRRAKMWCMARTPYDYTFYNDCDSLLVHPDIAKVFDGMGEKVYMCENLLHTVSRRTLMYIDNKGNKPLFHGAVAWYKKNDLNIDFMNTWWSEFVKQVSEPWPFSYSELWKQFDMFTLWKLTSGVVPGFDKFTGLVELGDRRFNCTIVDGGVTATNKPPVVIQIPRPTYKDNMPAYSYIYRNIKNAPAFTHELNTPEKFIKFN